MYIGLYMTLLLILTIHEQLKINSFKLNEISHAYQLDLSISVVGGIFHLSNDVTIIEWISSFHK